MVSRTCIVSDAGEVVEIGAAAFGDGAVAGVGELDAATQLLGAHSREGVFRARDLAVVAVDRATEQLELELGWCGVG
jgi:hypothetical protein